MGTNSLYFEQVTYLNSVVMPDPVDSSSEELGSEETTEDDE